MTQSLKAIIAWCLYDAAASSFSIIVTTFIFATYFTTHIAVNEIVGTYQWANATSLAGIIIAFTSPLFGAIADYGQDHKSWLLGFTIICITSCALLWFAYPNHHFIFYTLTVTVIGTVGLEIALVFYNAFLPEIAPKSYLGRISGWGWGCGYIGGIIALTLALVIFVQASNTWLNHQTAAEIRICGPFVALWYGLFALPLFLVVPSAKRKTPLTLAISKGCQDLWGTLKRLVKEKNILLYLIAHMIYADALNTLFVFGGIYAAGTYGLSFQEVLLFGITMNIASGIGALVFAFADDWLGSKITVLISLFFLVFFGSFLLLLHNKVLFWLMALLLCLFVGPAQSASRSLMVRLIAPFGGISTKMFGFYSLSGKITAFIGPWILGIVTLTFNSQRAGMATPIIFFALGFLLLLPVKLEHKALDLLKSDPYI